MPTYETLAGSTGFYENNPYKKALTGYTDFYNFTQRTEGLAGYTIFQDSCHGYGTEEITICQLVQIECTDGSIARFSDGDVDVEFEGYTWQAIPTRRGPIVVNSGLQVDKVNVDFGLVGVKVGPRFLSIPDVIRRDLLRDAHVKLWSYDYMLGIKRALFEGYVTDSVSFNKGIVSMSVACVLDKLQEKFPKIVYTELCNHVLFDSRCGLNKDSWDDTGTIGSGSSDRIIYSTIFAFAAHADGWFHRGEVKVTDVTSLNYGVSRSIIVHGDGYVKLASAFPDPIVIGEAITAYAGCDRTGETCSTKFSNYSNFFGFEYIPKPETLFGAIG